jgi:hypothetical protein
LKHANLLDDRKRFAALGVAYPYCLYKGEGSGEGWCPDWSLSGGRRISGEALNYFWVFVSVFFFVVFLGCVLERLFRHVSRNVSHLGAFWESFCDMLEVFVVLLDGIDSQAEAYIFRFWRSQVGICSSIFPGLDSGCVFNVFCVAFCDFGVI